MKKLNVMLTTFNVEDNFSLAAGYLAAYALRQPELADKVNMMISDFSQEHNDEIQVLYYLNNLKPDVIGFSCYCWNIDRILNLSALLKKVLPEIKVVLGGPEAGPRAKELLDKNDCLDIVVAGEGEAAFAEVLMCFLDSGKKLAGVRGIAYREGVKTAVTEMRPPLEDLDAIPSPYLTGVLQPRGELTYIQTYRGCPYGCAYCYEGGGEKKLRYFSDRRVEEEIYFMMNHPGVRSFSIIDPVFNLNKDRLEKLAGIIAERNIAKTRLHTIEIIAEQVDEKTVSLLKKASVESVEVGPQSVNPEALKNVNRNFDRDKFAAGVRLMEQAGINVIADLIIGLPGDDFFAFLKSVKYLADLEPHRIAFSLLRILPGTPLAEKAAGFKLLYGEEAPHYIVSNYSFSFTAIRKAEIFGKSFEKEYSLKLETPRSGEPEIRR